MNLAPTRRVLPAFALLTMVGCHARVTPMPPVPAPPAPVAGAASQPTPPVPALQRLVDSLTDAPAFRAAQWGVLIVDPVSGDTLASRHADKLFMPASNMKLVTGAVALARLGPAHRWTTRVLGAWAHSARTPGTLDGHLVVTGDFDPTMSDVLRGDAMGVLRTVADSLRAHGITRITDGRIVVQDADAVPAYGYGWALDDLLEPYSAGTGPVLLNEGVLRLVLSRCTAAGSALCGRTHPVPGLLAVHGTVTSDTVTRLESLRPDAAWGAGAVTAHAALRPGDSLVVEVAQLSPAGTYTAALGRALDDGGIRRGAVRTAARATVRQDTLAVFTSPPLAAVLPTMLQPSQNQLAEMFHRSLGAQVAPPHAVDSAARAVVEAQLAAWGAAADGHAIRDGSGLSRHNYLTPRTIIRVLDAMYRAPTFPLFREALPSAGVSGTIRSRMRGTAAAGRAFAKTGTLDKVRALSGYVQTADDQWVLFALLANNFTVPRQEVERVQDALVVHLASRRLAELRARP